MNLILAILVTWTMAAPLPGGGNDQYGLSKGSPEITLHLQSPLVSGNSVKLGYQIPYDGYIEFHLFDASGAKIWVDYGVQEKGDHYQALRKDKLKEGETYNYQFWYKGKPYEGKFSI